MLIRHQDENPIVGRPEPRWLRARRLAAWQRFQKLADPDFRYGQGTGFDPKTIRLPYQAMTRGEKLPAMAGSVPAGLESGLKAFPVSELDRLWSWHAATASRIRVITAAKDEHLKSPLRLETKLLSNKSAQELTVVNAAAGSELAIIEHVSGAGERAAATFVNAGDNAKVTIISIRDLERHSTEFVRCDAKLGRNARVVWLECVLGGSFASSSITNRLLGRGAAAVARTIFCGSGSSRFELTQTAQHQADTTSSDLLARGVLDGAARSLYRGHISVARGCPGCEAHQKEDTLLLGERAESSAIPILEIETDEIECGHGCTVGRLERDQLFYLMSRGLDERTATKLLVEGFFQPIVSGMQHFGLEEMVSCLIAGQLAPATSYPCL
ncbi:MAG: SufD family Fe-S cluster assembly protein [Patescibacteria group bacterium]|jgi:Fe-S cluster assembly protein SufD